MASGRPQLDFFADPDAEVGAPLRWSVSRYKRLAYCPRRYYFVHEALKGIKRPDMNADQRTLYRLKNLANRYMWVGQVVHQMIELAFGFWRQGKEVPPDALVERGTRLMRAQYAESLQKLYHERPHGALGLVEHEYELEIDKEEWQARRDQMERCLRHFFELPVVAMLRDLPEWRWLALESSGSFKVDGARVAVKPDAAWRDEDDQVVMLDWKTGEARPDDEWLQLAVYGIFARRVWKLGSDHFRGMTVYLSTGETKDWQIDQAQLQEAEERIRSSAKRMRDLAEDPAVERFPMTEDASRCRLCAFRGPCGRA